LEQVEEAAMDERQRRIDEIEAKAAESELIASLAADPEARIYNRRLAEELREYAQQLRDNSSLSRIETRGVHHDEPVGQSGG
jgi:hypothetical protein